MMSVVVRTSTKDGYVAELVDTFKKYDTNNDGLITLNDLKHLMSKLAEDEGEFVEIDMDKWLSTFDINGDNMFNLDEFLLMFYEQCLIGLMEV